DSSAMLWRSGVRLPPESTDGVGPAEAGHCQSCGSGLKPDTTHSKGTAHSEGTRRDRSRAPEGRGVNQSAGNVGGSHFPARRRQRLAHRRDDPDIERAAQPAWSGETALIRVNGDDGGTPV